MTNKKTAVITGGSRGIGKAIALKFSENSIFPIIISKTNENNTRLVNDIILNGNNAAGMICDVTNSNAVTSLITAIKLKYHQIDILINCAGISGGGVTKNIEDTLWLDVINTNLNSVFYMTRTCLKEDLIKKGGAIINIASTGGKQGVIHGAPYSASKHGVIGFTKSLGLELARDKSDITVNAICPGFVETAMGEQVRKNYAKLSNTDVDSVKKSIENRIPIGRYITPDEVAGMALYLSSDDTRSITAQAFNICGGLGNY